MPGSSRSNVRGRDPNVIGTSSILNPLVPCSATRGNDAMKRRETPVARDDASMATHGPLLSTRDRRALAVCVVFGLLSWIAILGLG